MNQIGWLPSYEAVLGSAAGAGTSSRVETEPIHFLTAKGAKSAKGRGNESNEGRNRSSKLPSWSWTACSSRTVHWSPACWNRRIGFLVNGDRPGINDGVKLMVNRL